MEKGGKPWLKEIGPFTYQEETERVEEVFHDNGTVSYKTQKHWYFLREESLSLDTIISTLDVPVLASSEFARGNWFNELSMAGMFQFRDSFFTNRTARELLFEGYSDSLLTAGSLFTEESAVPKDKFGWFYKRNGTTWNDGIINMATGASDFSDIGTIKSWHGSNRTIYPGKCGELHGTSAGFTSPKLDREYIDYFSTDICRRLRFEKADLIDIESVEARRFNLNAEKTFGNSKTNPENQCYHANFPPGLHNSTGCKGGDTTLKTFVSLPHFFEADPFYKNQFREGSLKPDPALHSSSISIQPETSIPLQVLMRLQVVIHVRSNSNIGGFMSDLPDIFLPVFWFDAEATVTAELAREVNIIPAIPRVALVIGIVSLVVGFSLQGFFIWLKLTGRLEKKSTEVAEDQT